MGTTLSLYARQRALAEQNGAPFTEDGTTYYALEIAGREATMQCHPNSAPDAFRWKYLCSTFVIVSEQVASRSTHYLFENFDADRDFGELTAQVSEVLDSLLD